MLIIRNEPAHSFNWYCGLFKDHTKASPYYIKPRKLKGDTFYDQFFIVDDFGNVNLVKELIAK